MAYRLHLLSVDVGESQLHEHLGYATRVAWMRLMLQFRKNGWWSTGSLCLEKFADLEIAGIFSGASSFESRVYAIDRSLDMKAVCAIRGSAAGVPLRY